METSKEITKDIDTGRELAHFSYYDGIKYAEKNNLKQDVSIATSIEDKTFIVMCGDVVTPVTEDMFPEIERRIF